MRGDNLDAGGGSLTSRDVITVDFAGAPNPLKF